MQFIDTHAHIYKSDFQKELSIYLERARSHAIEKIYMPNINEGTISSMMDVAALHPDFCLPMMGIHPCDITKNFVKQLYVVEDWLSKATFAAIGEVGIDLYHDTTLCEEQQEAFYIQLVFAKKYNLPLSIHCRNGFKEVSELLEQEQDGLLRGVIHCFTGSILEAEKYIDLGFYLGVGGIITLPSSGLSEVISAIPLKYLVLETDSPYLAPVPHRGKRNEPSYLRYTAAKLAALQGVSLEEVATITTQNAGKIFGFTNHDPTGVK